MYSNNEKLAYIKTFIINKIHENFMRRFLFDTISILV